MQKLRRIREQLSQDIQAMTFAEERAYLDARLADGPKPTTSQTETSSSPPVDTK